MWFASLSLSSDCMVVVKDFVYRVSIFDGKTPDMNVAVTVRQSEGVTTCC